MSQCSRLTSCAVTRIPMALSAPPEPNLPKQLNHQKQIQCRLKIAPEETTESTSKHYSIKSYSNEINTESSVLPGPATPKMDVDQDPSK